MRTDIVLSMSIDCMSNCNTNDAEFISTVNIETCLLRHGKTDLDSARRTFLSTHHYCKNCLLCILLMSLS